MRKARICFGVISALVLLYSIPAFAGHGPSGDEGMLSAGEMRAVIKAGGTFSSPNRSGSGGGMVATFNAGTNEANELSAKQVRTIVQQSYATPELHGKTLGTSSADFGGGRGHSGAMGHAVTVLKGFNNKGQNSIADLKKFRADNGFEGKGPNTQEYGAYGGDNSGKSQAIKDSTAAYRQKIDQDKAKTIVPVNPVGAGKTVGAEKTGWSDIELESFAIQGIENPPPYVPESRRSADSSSAGSGGLGKIFTDKQPIRVQQQGISKIFTGDNILKPNSTTKNSVFGN